MVILFVCLLSIKWVTQRHAGDKHDFCVLSDPVPSYAVDPSLCLGGRVLQRLARLLSKVGAGAVQAIQALRRRT